MEGLEPCYTAQEIADSMKVHVDTVRRIFRNEPGVITWGQPETRFKRAYQSIRIPHSVYERVKQRMSVKGDSR